MPAINELCSLPHAEFIAWVGSQDKEAKKKLKALNYELEVRREVVCLKLLQILNEKDSTSIKNLLKYSTSYTIHTQVQNYITIVQDKILVLEKEEWEKLSGEQQQTISNFSQSLLELNEDKLIDTVFVETKSKFYHLEHEIDYYSRSKKIEQTQTELEKIQSLENEALTNYLFVTFKLRALENILLKYRIKSIAQLPLESRSKVEKFRNDLSVIDDLGVLHALISDFQTQIKNVRDNLRRGHHVHEEHHMQLSLCLKDARIHLFNLQVKISAQMDEFTADRPIFHERTILLSPKPQRYSASPTLMFTQKHASHADLTVTSNHLSKFPRPPLFNA
ncbi:MAG: hypothetical protein A3F46_01235 [Legionellales bacterium RIFCSPHIGHO2_12_FULL_42_9]|nr:MAG: hypothetical protein A3F46_01235 [Legionellales bacterium RIFCSPHIGHO2_12_FULL_42_9]